MNAKVACKFSNHINKYTHLSSILIYPCLTCVKFNFEKVPLFFVLELDL